MTIIHPHQEKALSRWPRTVITAVMLSLAFTAMAQTAGIYYLRHKTTRQYLVAGGLYGTQAILGPHAIPMKLEDNGSGQFYIFTDYASSSDGYLGVSGNNVYLDSSRQAWTISEGQTGTYTIMSGANSYLSSNGTTVSANSREAGTNAQWELLTRSQLIDAMLQADGESDATFLISNPRFDRHHSEGAWSGSTFNTGGERGDNGNGNYCAEVWYSNFDVHQTLTDIPNGRYRLSVQGFYRYNNGSDNTNEVALTTHADGTEQCYALLYGGQTSVALQSIASEAASIATLGLSASNAGLPYSMAEAANAFTAGLYGDNQMEVTVADHQLTIGIRKTQMDGCDWTIWDNFQLTLLETGDNTGWTPADDSTTPHYDQATWDHPIDVTTLIENPDFENASGWKGYPAIGGQSGNRNAEKYNTTFDVYQTLTGIPNGYYRLSAQGFYRYGDYHDEQHKSYNGGGWEENDANNIYAVYTIPYAVISRQQGIERHLATLYANDVEQGLPSPFDYAHEQATHPDDYPTPLGWVPDTQNGASGAFTDGEYPVSLLVPVTDGTLRLGVRKTLGYKYDWACWDHFQLHYLGADRLVYADGITLNHTTLGMTVNEKRHLTATITPADVSAPTLTWTSSDHNVVTVDTDGLLTAVGIGSATITATAKGSEGGQLAQTAHITVSAGSSQVSQLIINEIQVSNIDMFVDPTYNYGAYIELYNPTDQGISLDGLYLSDDATQLTKSQLTARSGAVPAKGHAIVWMEHHDLSDGQADLELNMDGGMIYLSDSNGRLITSQAYPAAISRTSYGRTTDGGSTWAITAYPTPGTSNAGSREWVDAQTYSRLAEPTVSHPSQLFSTPFTLTADIPDGATLRYTTDGSTPTDTHGATSADGHFDIQGTTILRLRLYKSGMLPSPVHTCSYLQRDHDYMLPVLSVVSDPVHFYSDTLGVFVTGTHGISGSGISYPCNWNMDWDRPVGFNYLGSDGIEIFSQEATLKRFGGWSRSWYPFNFKLHAKKEYEGRNFIDHQPFALKPALKHKVWQLRNGGNDLYCRIKDVAMQQIIMTSGLHLDCQDYQPVHSFINGRYQGMLNLREPSNKHFAYANYGIDTDQMDQLELGSGITVNAGNSEAFTQWMELSEQATDEAVYAEIASMVDIDEFANYMATQLFLGGDDWPGNNCKAFKGSDGKWHIVLFDIDQALRFDAYAFTHLTSNSNCPLVTIFLRMMRNATFRKHFIDAFCLVAGSVFEPTRSAAIIDRLSVEMDPALSLEGLSTQPTAGYVKAALSATRRDAMMSALATWSHAQINTPAQRVTLASSAEAATLRLNGIEVPTGRFDGTLFAPAILTACAPEGYVFNGWTDGDGQQISDSPTLDIAPLGDITLTACWTPLRSDNDLVDAIAVPVKVNEVSASNNIYINDWAKKSDWIELYNNTDSDLDATGLYVSDDPDQPLKYQIKGSGATNTIIPARGHLIVWADQMESLTQLHGGFKLANDSGSIVTIASSDEFVEANSDYFTRHPDLQAFADGMTYISHRGDQTVGRYPDGGHGFYLMSKPTYDSRNIVLTADPLIGEDHNLMKSEEGPFTLALATGWNWISHPLATPVGSSQLSAQAQRIVGDATECYLDSRYGMTGTLKSLEAGHLYKVQMRAADTFTHDGADSRGNMPISLRKGWNWIGYPIRGAQAVSAALADYPAEEGEAIIGQDGFAAFSGGRWSGSLTTLETGKGYLLHTLQAKTLRFRVPTVQLSFAPRAKSRQAMRYGIDAHAHPSVMGVIARLCADGQAVEPGRLTLLAFAGIYIVRYSDGSSKKIRIQP